MTGKSKYQTVNFLFFLEYISKYEYVYFSNQLHTRKYEHWKMRFMQGLTIKTKFNLQYNFNASINRPNEHLCRNEFDELRFIMAFLCNISRTYTLSSLKLVFSWSIECIAYLIKDLILFSCV